MNLQELAYLVAIRNHIITVLGDKSSSNKDDIRPLNAKRIALDKVFISEILAFDPNKLNLFSKENNNNHINTSTSVNEGNLLPVSNIDEKQMVLNFNTNSSSEKTTEVFEDTKIKNAIEATAADADVSRRIAEEKAKLKAKSVKKANKDVSE
jgi:hypothetical protein